MKPFLPKKIIHIISTIFLLISIGIIIYILLLPIYPLIKYKQAATNINPKQQKELIQTEIKKIINNTKATSSINSPKQDQLNSNKNTPHIQTKKQTEPKIILNNINRLIIPKIGVNIPIIESTDPVYGLNHGAWHVPESSTPPQGSNTVITAHRFKYLPPSNLTFYLLDKLQIGDIIGIIWDDKEYYYQVQKTKIVPKNDISILENSPKSILTLYTCDPIYSQKNRLVVIANLIDK